MSTKSRPKYVHISLVEPVYHGWVRFMVMGKQNIEISPRTMTSVVRVNFSKKRLIVIAIFKSTEGGQISNFYWQERVVHFFLEGAGEQKAGQHSVSMKARIRSEPSNKQYGLFLELCIKTFTGHVLQYILRNILSYNMYDYV